MRTRRSESPVWDRPRTRRGRFAALGRLAAGAVVLLLSAATASAALHPSVLIAPADLPARLAETQTTHQEIWAKIAGYTESQLGTRPPLESELPDTDSPVPWKEYGSRLYPFAFASLISGDPRYADLVREWVLGMCEWTTWGPQVEAGGDLGAAHVLLGVSIGYDWAYDRFTADERALIEGKVAIQAALLWDYATGIRPVFWRDAYRTNHNHINNVALGVAGVAFRDVIPQAAQWKLQADRNMRRVLDAFAGVTDGSYHEGYNYWSYTVSYVLLYLDLVRQHDGIDAFQGNAWLENAAYFRLYGMMPTPQVALDIADSHPRHRSPRDILRKLAAEYGNGYAEWLVQHWGPDDTVSSAYMAPWEFLWYDPAVPPRDPSDLPLARHFSDWGVVIMRGGWGPDDTFLSLRSGAPGGRFGFEQVRDGVPGAGDLGAGHDDPDQNSFTFAAAGQYLATDNGEYYDPKLTRSQNTILVNDRGQIGEGRSALDQAHPEFWTSAGRILAFENTAGTAYAMGDAAASYPSQLGLTQFVRRILFVRPGLALLVDNLAAAQPSTFSWILRNWDGQLSRQGPTVRSTVGGASLNVLVAEPGTFVTRPDDDLLRYRMMRIEPSAPAAAERFVMLLSATAAGSPAPSPGLRRLSSPGGDLGVRIDTAQGSSILILRGAPPSGPPASAMQAGPYRSDGAAAVLSLTPSGALRSATLLQGTGLGVGVPATSLLGASRRATLESSYVVPGEIALTYSLPEGEALVAGDWLGCYASGSVSRVTVNGVPAAFTRSGNQVRVDFGPATTAAAGSGLPASLR